MTLASWTYGQNVTSLDRKLLFGIAGPAAWLYLYSLTSRRPRLPRSLEEALGT